MAETLKEGLEDYMAENYPDEDWEEVTSPVRAAYESGWLDGEGRCVAARDAALEALRDVARCECACSASDPGQNPCPRCRAKRALVRLQVGQ